MGKVAIGVIVLLALVALALGGPDRSAQANHRGGFCDPIVPHLFMEPATTIQPDQLHTFDPPADVTATLTFNRAIADTVVAHGLQFMSMTGPGLNTPATSFGPVTNGDRTVEINFSGAAVAAALDADLANAGQLQANVELTVHGHWDAQPHLFDVDENVCPTHAEGTDTIHVKRVVKENASINLVNQPGCGLKVGALAQVAEPTLVAEGDLIGANRTVQGEIRIANTGSPGPVGVETVRITIFWQPGGGSWTSADPQAVYSTLAPGEVINKDQERTFTYSASFTAPAEATEFRSVVEVTVAGRADTFSDTRHFRPCELLDDLEKELDG